MMSERDFENVCSAIREATRMLDKSDAACVRLAFDDMFHDRYDDYDALEFWSRLPRNHAVPDITEG